MSAPSHKTAFSCCHHVMTRKIQQKTFQESDTQAAQRAAHLPFYTQHGPMCIYAYDETSDSAGLHPSASLTFAADRTREFLLDCTETSAQASLSPPRTCTISWLNLHDRYCMLSSSFVLLVPGFVCAKTCHLVHPRSPREGASCPLLLPPGTLNTSQLLQDPLVWQNWAAPWPSLHARRGSVSLPAATHYKNEQG